MAKKPKAKSPAGVHLFELRDRLAANKGYSEAERRLLLVLLDRHIAKKMGWPKPSNLPPDDLILDLVMSIAHRTRKDAMKKRPKIGKRLNLKAARAAAAEYLGTSDSSVKQACLRSRRSGQRP